MANIVQRLYEEMIELHVQLRRTRKEKKIHEAVAIALSAVFEKWNLFEGYNLGGYLECYVTKIRLQGVPEDCMVASF